jgi:hypothetical protein
LDKLLDEGEIDLMPRDALPGGDIPVPSIADGPRGRESAAWILQVLRELSVKARRYGLFALESDAASSSDPLLAEGLRALVDGTEASMIQEKHRSLEGGEIERIVEEGIIALHDGRCLG